MTQTTHNKMVADIIAILEKHEPPVVLTEHSNIALEIAIYQAGARAGFEAGRDINTCGTYPGCGATPYQSEADFLKELEGTE